MRSLHGAHAIRARRASRWLSVVHARQVNASSLGSWALVAELWLDGRPYGANNLHGHCTRKLGGVVSCRVSSLAYFPRSFVDALPCTNGLCERWESCFASSHRPKSREAEESRPCDDLVRPAFDAHARCRPASGWPHGVIFGLRPRRPPEPQCADSAGHSLLPPARPLLVPGANPRHQEDHQERRLRVAFLAIDESLVDGVQVSSVCRTEAVWGRCVRSGQALITHFDVGTSGKCGPNRRPGPTTHPSRTRRNQATKTG